MVGLSLLPTVWSWWSGKCSSISTIEFVDSVLLATSRVRFTLHVEAVHFRCQIATCPSPCSLPALFLIQSLHHRLDLGLVGRLRHVGQMRARSLQLPHEPIRFALLSAVVLLDIQRLHQHSACDCQWSSWNVVVRPPRRKFILEPLHCGFIDTGINVFSGEHLFGEPPDGHSAAPLSIGPHGVASPTLQLHSLYFAMHARILGTHGFLFQSVRLRVHWSLWV